MATRWTASHSIDFPPSTTPSNLDEDTSDHRRQFVHKSLSLDSGTRLLFASHESLILVDGQTGRQVGGYSFSTEDGGGDLMDLSVGEGSDGVVWITRRGRAEGWDMRVGSASSSPSVILSGSHRQNSYLTSAVSHPSSKGTALALGTDYEGDDAFIEIWDPRNPSKPFLSHSSFLSDDVTSLSFSPSSFPLSSLSSTSPTSNTFGPLLLAGSTSGLIYLLDPFTPESAQSSFTEDEPENDAVLTTVNIGASVAKVGWISPTGGPSMDMDNDAPMDEEQGSSSVHAFASTDMCTLSVCDLSFSNVTPPNSPVLGGPSQRKSGVVREWGDIREREVYEADSFWNPEYVIDVDEDTTGGLNVWVGQEESGSFGLLSLPPTTISGMPSGLPSRSQPFGTVGTFRGGHRDTIVRTICPGTSGTLFSGGEDGKVCAWQRSQ